MFINSEHSFSWGRISLLYSSSPELIIDGLAGLNCSFWWWQVVWSSSLLGALGGVPYLSLEKKMDPLAPRSQFACQITLTDGEEKLVNFLSEFSQFPQPLPTLASTLNFAAGAFGVPCVSNVLQINWKRV